LEKERKGNEDKYDDRPQAERNGRTNVVRGVSDFRSASTFIALLVTSIPPGSLFPCGLLARHHALALQHYGLCESARRPVRQVGKLASRAYAAQGI
jgi:hypothetical protein